MRGGIQLKYFLFCTHKRSLQNICQEFWAPSLGFFLYQAQHVKVSAHISCSPHDGPSTLFVLDVE